MLVPLTLIGIVADMCCRCQGAYASPLLRLFLADTVQESDTGLAPPHLWDIAADRQRMSEDHPLQVARCTKIIQDDKDSEKSKYVINVKQIAKFVVKLGERVSPTDIEEGMRVGYGFSPSYLKKSPVDTSPTASTAINMRSSCPFRRRSTPP